MIPRRPKAGEIDASIDASISEIFQFAFGNAAPRHELLQVSAFMLVQVIMKKMGASYCDVKVITLCALSVV